MKIFIIGGPGSGKTTLAKRLSERYGIPRCNLDDLFWDNTAAAYGTKRNPAERDALLDQVLSREDWIVEGVYYAWCGRCFREADRICFLNVPRRVYRRRIIKRFVRRKLGIKKERRRRCAPCAISSTGRIGTGRRTRSRSNGFCAHTPKK